MKRLFLLSIGCGFFFINTLVASAETHIPSGIISDNTVWTASSSPYIIDGNVDIARGRTLTIEPGVVIDTHLTGDDRPMIGVENSSIIINGTESNPVTIRNLWDISIFQATVTISHLHMSAIEGGLSLYESNADIKYSTFAGAYNAIQINGGTTTIASSSVSAEHSSIYIQNSMPVLVMSTSSEAYGIGGIGNALDPYSATVVVTNSSFFGTSTIAIDNTGAIAENIVSAIGNWWGRSSGPAGNISADISVRVRGPVNYTPWLMSEPDLVDREIAKTICCSSVLFIPGLESSRLYRDEKGLLGVGTSTNTLWEPNRNDDVRALFLNVNGSSTDKSIYSGGPIGSAWTYGVYGKFMKFLDSLVAGGNIGSWQGFGYDWRKSIPDVVLGLEKKATTTESLIDTVTKLAKDSKTGKVTIIAHSNGGLVAKYLVKTLADSGKANLIDSVISVAVPYLGTPQAIGGILHGDDESLAGGLLLKASVARQLGQNMPSAYSLLPSTGYYSQVPGSTISFATDTPVNINNGSYPRSIVSFADMSSFVTDAKNMNTRVSSSSTDVVDLVKGNASLMASAANLHGVLDNFVWPSAITNWAIVGWNALTTKAIEYSSRNHCSMTLSGWSCTVTPTHEQVKSNMGDGTVVTESASFGAEAQTIATIDLHAIDGGKTVHANILESSTTQSVIADLISQKSSDISSVHGVTLGKPDSSKESTYIVISTHSPIQPHLYDASGNHTGEIAGPADTEDLYRAYEQNIPGSTFSSIANTDTDYDTYISVPDDGQKYSLVMKGTGLGGFTLDIDRVRGGEVLNHSEYAGLPVTPLTVASTTIQFVPYVNGGSSGGGSSGSNGGSDGSSEGGSSISSSTFVTALPVLNIDVNGDGSTDVNATHDATTTVSTDSYLDILKKTCESLNRHDKGVKNQATIGASYCKDIPKRIDTIKDKIKKGKLGKLKHDNNSLDKMAKLFKHRDWKKIGDTDYKDIESMIDGFVSQFE